MTTDAPNIEVLEGEQCPICGEKTLTLTEMTRDIAFFGELSLFSMTCSSCHYHKADVESLEEHEPAKFSFTVESEEDLKVRVIKSSMGLVKFGRLGSIEPGEAANGYITNIEGLINRIKQRIEFIRDNSDDADERKKAKNHMKKITRVLWGQEALTITIEDPTGNSAIISEKAEKTKLKKKK